MTLLDKLSGALFSNSERARHRAFLDAAMAASALVATADGEVSFAARHRLDEVLANVEALRAFDVHDAVNRFKAFAEDLRADPEAGRTQALAAVAAVADDPEGAEVLLRIACALARADGSYSQPGLLRVREIAEALGQAMPEVETGEAARAAGAARKPRFIAVGNHKGGTGKSTTAVLLAVGLVRRGERVACIDLDGQQGTLSRYLANRGAGAASRGKDLPMPLHLRVEPADDADRAAARAKEERRFDEARAAVAECDFVVLDTPGHDTHLTRLGHRHADILLTPLNDSFLDADVLAEVDRERRLVVGPSTYARMVMRQSERRVSEGRAPIDWIVMRNRLSQLDARATRDMARLLEQLAERMGFRLWPGLSERMVYRELFYSGLTVLDIPQGADEARTHPSRWNARRELAGLLEAVAKPAAVLH